MSARVAQAQLRRGLSKPSLYKLEVPRSIKNGNFSANDYLEYYCKSVSLPGIAHDIHLINGHTRQGVVSSQPYGIKYGKPLTITERSDYHAYEQFQEWFSLTARNALSLSGAQRMSYRNEYTCPILLRKYELPTYDGDLRPIDFVDRGTDLGFRVALDVTFDSCYVSNIGDISYSSESRDAMVEYQVEFMFDSYQVLINNDSQTR
jgi:hypothetical protein